MTRSEQDLLEKVIDCEVCHASMDPTNSKINFTLDDSLDSGSMPSRSFIILLPRRM